LIVWFGRYLARTLDPSRVRVRAYEVPGQPPDERVRALTDEISIRPSFKMKRTAYHVYVNSRPLLREFRAGRSNLMNLDSEVIGPYFAGRFDGDGAFGTRRVPGARIAYGTREEAAIDADLLARTGIRFTSIHSYAKANEHCIYIKKPDLVRFGDLIASHSWKANCRFTL